MKTKVADGEVLQQTLQETHDIQYVLLNLQKWRTLITESENDILQKSLEFYSR